MPQPVQQQAQSQPTGQEGSGMMGHGGTMAGGMMGHGMMGGGAMGPPPVISRTMFALIDTDSDEPFHCRSFRRLTNEFLRQWTPAKMANSRWRR